MVTPYRNHLHLYRALLRETTYLCDPAAKAFHHEYINWSFRRSNGKQTAPYAESAGLPTKYQSQQLKRARKHLYTLERANQGYIGALRNVLRMAYARKGRRRRELVKGMMVSTSDDMSSAVSQPLHRHKFTKDWRPPATFTMLLNSQKRVQQHLDASGKVKPLPVIPTQNRWNKPYPPSRIPKVFKQWYAWHANILQVPLSEKEWLGIYKVSLGTSSLHRGLNHTRRPLGSVSVFSSESKSMPMPPAVANIGRTSSQAPEQQHSKRVRSLIGNPHRMTRRYVRRLLQYSVLQNTPTILAKPDGNGLALRWESGIKTQPEPQVASRSQELSLFD